MFALRRMSQGSQGAGCTFSRTFVSTSSPILYPRLRPAGLRRSTAVNHREQALPEERTSGQSIDEYVDEISKSEESVGAPVIEEIASNTKTVPWFMEYNKQFEEEYPLEKRQLEPVPEIPEDSPSVLSALTTYMTQDLILKDLTLIDLRERENPWGSGTMMLLATARSERQLRSSAESLKGYLRGAGCKPRVDGLIKWENTKVKRRRRRKMIGRANYQIEDDRLHWILIDVGADTGVILQLFSEEGRVEYALEDLWGNRANNVVPSAPTTTESSESRLWYSKTTSPGLGPLSKRLGIKFEHKQTFSSAVPANSLVISESTDAYTNLAFEDYLFRTADLPCMLLYRNTPAVVIGRNQNPWLEADLDHLATHDIQFVRRYSGGGAVYHDLGNTNYSFMMSRAAFDRDSTAEKIIAGLRSIGRDVALNARHDITVYTSGSYRKCSGSAYKITKDRAYAHGTMLLNAKLETLGPALRPKDAGIKGNGVDSVRSAVANLLISHEDFCDVIAKSFDLNSVHMSENTILSIDKVRESVQQLTSDAWKFRQTPSFTQTVSCGNDVVVVTVKQGCFAEFAGPDDLVKPLHALLHGKEFGLGMVNARLACLL